MTGWAHLFKPGSVHLGEICLLKSLKFHCCDSNKLIGFIFVLLVVFCRDFNAYINLHNHEKNLDVI